MIPVKEGRKWELYSDKLLVSVKLVHSNARDKSRNRARRKHRTVSIHTMPAPVVAILPLIKRN